MNEAVQTFLNKATTDSADLLAKRALKALLGLRQLEENFRARGIMVLLQNIFQGLRVASSGFAFINTVKDYGFAEEVAPGLTAFTAEIKATFTFAGDVLAAAEEQVDFAEQLVAALSQYYAPVLIIRGVRSVTILRGDFAAAAAAQMKLANDN